MKRVAILTSDRLPAFLVDSHGPIDEHLEEDRLFADALRARGKGVDRVPWRAGGVRWADYDVVVIRSTWDYIDDLERFLAVLSDIDAASRLVNPLETVRWNCDKAYLLDLAERGAPVVPTWLVPGGGAVPNGGADLGPAPAGWVLKPAVGVGSFETIRTAGFAEIEDALADRSPSQRYLLQPYLRSVAEEGEWAFIFFDGRLRYTLIKRPAEGDFRVQEQYGGTWTPERPAPADVAAAEAVMAVLPVPVTYARVDMARLPSGNLALMELEAIEPSLAFHLIPGAADDFAKRIIGAIA